MMDLEARLDLGKVVSSANVAELLSAGDCALIADQIVDDWELDQSSRADWETRTKESLNLALQVVETKTFPWPNCSNIKFPLITIAALQYHARAYPALLPGPDVVKCRLFGQDPQGVKGARAARVSSHMSFQVLEEDESWEDNHDRALITQPIVGCAFKKTYFDPGLGHNVSYNVLARDLYIPYFAKSLEAASRITEILYYSSNDMLERERSKVFLCGDARPPEQTQQGEVLVGARNKAQGLNPPLHDDSTPYELLEQHCWIDLDGDGYQEPYIVTVRKDTGELKRIVARFTSRNVKKNAAGEVQRIAATNYYTKYPFIPSPDGGIYDLGFGSLLGPISQSIDTIMNQMVDAGTMANTAGGFLGRGAKFRSGESSFRPFEWKRVDASGDDLRKNIVPYIPKEPSEVLFKLLALLINYGERIGGATDPMVGENPGQNTPAETSRNMTAEGTKVFKGIFKRTYRAMKEEFRKMYLLNQVYLDEEVEYYSLASDIPSRVLAADYLPSEKTICPAADPNMVSDSERIAQATFLKQASMTTQGYDRVEVERRLLAAFKIPDISVIYPGPDKVTPLPNPKMEIEKMKIEQQREESQMNMRMAALELMGEAELNQAKMMELQARAIKHLAEADGVESGHEIAMIEAQIGAAKAHQEGLLKSIEIIQKGIDREQKGSQRGGMERVGKPPSNAGLQEFPSGIDPHSPAAVGGGSVH